MMEMETGGKMADKLTDQSPMPFGKYGPHGAGLKMQQVPARYLLWLWNYGLAPGGSSPQDSRPELEEDRSAVREYIRENMSALQQEDPDTIIKHH